MKHLLPLALVALASIGCNDDPTTVALQNGFAPPSDGAATAAMTVFKAWWETTLFPAPVAPGATSEIERTIPATAFAYVLLAPRWSADDAGPPPRLIALESEQALSATEHHLLNIVVSDEQWRGDCAAGKPLDADDAQLIVERIFPGDFAGQSYDPATCTTAPAAADAGAAGDGAAD